MRLLIVRREFNGKFCAKNKQGHFYMSIRINNKLHFQKIVFRF